MYTKPCVKTMLCLDHKSSATASTSRSADSAKLLSSRFLSPKRAKLDGSHSASRIQNSYSNTDDCLEDLKMTVSKENTLLIW